MKKKLISMVLVLLILASSSIITSAWESDDPIGKNAVAPIFMYQTK